MRVLVRMSVFGVCWRRICRQLAVLQGCLLQGLRLESCWEGIWAGGSLFLFWLCRNAWWRLKERRAVWGQSLLLWLWCPSLPEDRRRTARLQDWCALSFRKRTRGCLVSCSSNCWNHSWAHIKILEYWDHLLLTRFLLMKASSWAMASQVSLSCSGTNFCNPINLSLALSK